MKIHHTHVIVDCATGHDFCRQCQLQVRWVDEDSLAQPCERDHQCWYIRLSKFTDKELEVLLHGVGSQIITLQEGQTYPANDLHQEIAEEINRRKGKENS